MVIKRLKFLFYVEKYNRNVFKIKFFDKIGFYRICILYSLFFLEYFDV